MTINGGVLEEAERLYRLGLAVHWLKPGEKRPVNSGWSVNSVCAPRDPWEKLKQNYREGYNVGIRLGRVSKLKNGFLCVTDVDLKSSDPRHKAEAAKVAKSVLNGGHATAPIVQSGRGNGSRHYYGVTTSPFKSFKVAASEEKVKVLMPSVFPSKKELSELSEKEIKEGWRIRPAWEVSLMSEGTQVVAPPSIHPDTGNQYLWRRPFEGGIPLLSLDIALSNYNAVNTEKKIIDVKPILTLSDFQTEDVDINWLPGISEKMRRAITEGIGVTDRSGFLLKACAALISAGLNQNEVLSVLTDPKLFLGAVGYDHAQTRSRKQAARWVYRYTFKKVSTERSPEGKFPHHEEVWKRDLTLNKQGNVAHMNRNLDVILEKLIGPNLFVYDVFDQKIKYGMQAPWGKKIGEALEDIDLIQMKLWFSYSEFQIEPAVNLIFEAVQFLAGKNPIHPVKDYLNSLKWDGVPRINTWLRDYCGASELEPYLSEVSRKFLVAMVKRIFEPGCQWDYILVLEGKQGIGKSSIARALAGDDWFMDNLPDLKDKDAMLYLQGRWLVELGELANVKHSDFNLVKVYLSRRIDSVRPPYGRMRISIPRSSVFLGTVNEGAYFKDPTGNRRYWPIKVHRCDVEGLFKVRDQLFAEALAVYQAGTEILTLEGTALDQSEIIQDHKRVEDDETEMSEALYAFIASDAGKEFSFDRFRIRDLMTGVNAPWGAWVNKGFAANRAGQILCNFGFDKTRVKGQRWWRSTPETVKKISEVRGAAEGVPLK